jgi:hypothetical protein
VVGARGALKTALLAVVAAGAAWSAVQETAPPDRYYRQVQRTFEAGPAFALVEGGRPAFDILPADSKDEILSTAAADFGRYFRERWQSGPALVRRPGDSRKALIVLASQANLGRLPGSLRQAAGTPGPLAAEAFLIQWAALAGGRPVLFCVGGSPIGARYALSEIIRRMERGADSAVVRINRLRDEPYSSFRAVYINDSAHQVNNYSPNLIFPVPTYRWPIDKWQRYLDQLAFFRFNVLMIWITPQMYTPRVFSGGEEFTYFRDTMRAIGQYGRPRGITLCLVNGVNVSVDAGTRLDSIPAYKELPLYRYLSPLKPDEKKLNLALWDYWSKAIPEVGIWELFPGDPGGCHEEGCGPETYVDLALELTAIIKRNNPSARIDFCPWQFFGWGPSWPAEFRKDTRRVDRGYEYLMSKLDAFPPDTMFSPNLNDFTSERPIAGAGFGGGSTVKYIERMARAHMVHTWTYFSTEGEGWINHHYKVPGILRQRELEARYPISGGLCYTMTPALNILNQFACSEGFWNPQITAAEVMHRYTEGVFSTSAQSFIDVFPTYDVAPMVGYTFGGAPSWRPDYAKLNTQMTHNREVFTSLDLAAYPRFVIQPSPREYAAELIYYAGLYEKLSRLGLDVARARTLVGSPKARIAEARARAASLGAAEQAELHTILARLEVAQLPEMKAAFRSKHYQLFIDHPTEFTHLLPGLIDGFFNAFGADFLQD